MSCTRHCSRRTTLLRIQWQELVQLGISFYRVARICRQRARQHNQEWVPDCVVCPVRFFMPYKFDSSTIIFSPDAREGHANAPRLSQTHTGCEDIGTSEYGAGQACDVSKLPLVLCG